MHDLAIYVTPRLAFVRELSLDNSKDSYLCFWLVLPHLVSYFLFLFGSPFSSLCKDFDAISSKTNEVSSINSSANVFGFGNFDIHYKDWSSCFGGTDRPGELYHDYFMSNDLTWIVKIPAGTPDCDSQSPALLDLILLALFSISSTVVFLTFTNSNHVVPQFPLTFLQTQKRIPLFTVHLMTILLQIGTVFMIISEMFHGRIILTSMLLRRWWILRVSQDWNWWIYPSKVKSHSSLWFSATCAADIAHKNHFFHWYQQNKSSATKVSLLMQKLLPL